MFLSYQIYHFLEEIQDIIIQEQVNKGEKEKKHFEVNPLKERQNFMPKIKKKRFYWNYMVRNETKYPGKIYPIFTKI